jgi:hypothetical protein
MLALPSFQELERHHKFIWATLNRAAYAERFVIRAIAKWALQLSAQFKAAAARLGRAFHRWGFLPGARPSTQRAGDLVHARVTVEPGDFAARTVSGGRDAATRGTGAALGAGNTAGGCRPQRRDAPGRAGDKTVANAGGTACAFARPRGDFPAQSRARRPARTGGGISSR